MKVEMLKTLRGRIDGQIHTWMADTFVDDSGGKAIPSPIMDEIRLMDEGRGRGTIRIIERKPGLPPRRKQPEGPLTFDDIKRWNTKQLLKNLRDVCPEFTGEELEAKKRPELVALANEKLVKKNDESGADNKTPAGDQGPIV